jgi:ribosomal protein S18 acetylase RimI-like enzyme
MTEPFEIHVATRRDLPSWMQLVELVRWGFPGLETEDALNGYVETVEKNMDRNSAICAKVGDRVVGVLLFSEKQSVLGCLAVHPDFRKMGIATAMVERMLAQLPADRDVTVTTYREEDGKGLASRAFYRKLGFVEGELCHEFDYPEQRFVLRKEARKA